MRAEKSGVRGTLLPPEHIEKSWHTVGNDSS